MGVSANMVLGQRAIFDLGAEVRSRLNGMYMAIFCGWSHWLRAGLGVRHGRLESGNVGWRSFPILALLYFYGKEGRTAI